MKAREVAYLSLLASLREEAFIAQSLDRMQKSENLSPLDYAFAYEIAAGSARMALALDYLAERLSAKQKLSLKLKERALLRTAIYQYSFMDKVPVYAIVNETIELAKKYTHSTFVKFLNALLRKLESVVPTLPEGDSSEDLSIRYSYPKEFINQLINDYGSELTKHILAIGNKAAGVMVRIRPGCTHEVLEDCGIEKVQGNLPIGHVKARNFMTKISDSVSLYIQNATPVALLSGLVKHSDLNGDSSYRMLDLCSSPGGKLLALHDLYPNAQLLANDISEDKVCRLNENLSKYGVRAEVSCSLGEEYCSQELFDLVVLDVPCSNSGVLNKRPEARFRISAEGLLALRKKQLALLENALKLVKPNGEIWFMTCSILKEENERVVEVFCRKAPVRVVHMETILPNSEGFDGGFACLLKRVEDA